MVSVNRFGPQAILWRYLVFVHEDNYWGAVPDSSRVFYGWVSCYGEDHKHRLEQHHTPTDSFTLFSSMSSESLQYVWDFNHRIAIVGC